MKNLLLFLTALTMGTGGSLAITTENSFFPATTFGHSNSYIFVENGISFAVYPDGEFDFYIQNPIGVQAVAPVGATAITFNAGFNYNSFVQYDDFGAVIQVQQVPVFYDYYGRVRRIGNVHMSYWNGRLYRLGGMRIYYNSFGYYNYHVGYINPYNRFYVYQPFHGYFVRPAANFCMVYTQPYRRYYHPVRYTYYRPYHNNVRRAYTRVGNTHKHNYRVERSRIYRNDKRVVADNAMGIRSNVRRTSGKSTVTSDRTSRAVNRSDGRSTSARSQKDRYISGRSITHKKAKTPDNRYSSASSNRVKHHSGTVQSKRGKAQYASGRTKTVREGNSKAKASSNKHIASTRKYENKGRRSQSVKEKSGREIGRSGKRNPR